MQNGLRDRSLRSAAAAPVSASCAKRPRAQSKAACAPRSIELIPPIAAP